MFLAQLVPTKSFFAKELFLAETIFDRTAGITKKQSSVSIFALLAFCVSFMLTPLFYVVGFYLRPKRFLEYTLLTPCLHTVLLDSTYFGSTLDLLLLRALA